MELTTEQRQELADALSLKSDIKVIEDFAVELTDQITPIVQRWITDYEFALMKAESFIRGFEDDEMQVGINELLAEIRNLLAFGAASPQQTYQMRVRYVVRGGHTHFNIYTGKFGCILGGSVEQGTMTNEEFEAFRNGLMWKQFVNDDKR